MSTALLKKPLACGPAGRRAAGPVGRGNPDGRNGVHKIEVRAADKM